MGNPIELASRIVQGMRLGLLIGLALAATVLTACGSDSNEAATTGAAGGGQTVAISETEFALDPSSVQVDTAGTVTFRVTNDGGADHALEVDGEGIEEETGTIRPGESAELTVELKEGSYELYCPIGNHRDQGMEGTLTVGAGGAGAGTGTMEDEDEGSTT
jgi:uncharacterized cupredoxin-like copper-binding protein